jgi:hypothetical protein
LEQEYQKALNDISTHHIVGLFWVTGHSGVQGNETANKLTRNGTVQKSVGPEPASGVPRQNIRIKIKSWERQPAYGNVVGSYQNSETGSKTDFKP